MLDSVAWTALVMGLVGGSHCIAMCAAPCALLTGTLENQKAISVKPEHVISIVSGTTEALPHITHQSRSGFRGRWAAYHAGRLLGYGVMGGVAAWSMEILAWASDQTMALRPVWTFAHVVMLAWGLLMLLQARQPVWIEQAGRTIWHRIQPIVRERRGVFVAGVLWSLMPCGLLYSALLVAALSGSIANGAFSMLLFAAGSGLWLVAGPMAWTALRKKMTRWNAEWGSRVAGGLLCGVAVWALWMDLVYKPSLWCR